MKLVFDWDDTALLTHPYYVKVLKETHGDDLPLDQYFTKDNGGTGFLGLMESGSFMDKVEIRSGFIEMVRRLVAEGHEIYSCSHRGYHRMGHVLTRKLFTEEEWNLFTEHYFLDPATTPNKVEFLQEVFDGEDFIIFDDRPHFTCEHSEEDAEHIVLFDQPWNKELPFDRVFAFDENFISVLDKKLEIYSNF